MRVVRGNTLPDYSLMSQIASGASIDGYQHHEKWQYQPIMGVNVDEVSGSDIETISEDDLDSFRRLFAETELVPSAYNIIHKFDDGLSVVLNMLTEGIAVLSEEEISKLVIQQVDEKTTVTTLQLFRLGMLVRSDDDEAFKLNVIRSRSAFASSDAINFIIYPTMGCNARCAYCFEEGVPRQKMSEQTVQDTVRFILRNVAFGDEVVFRWFGGEPLTAAGTITRICEDVSAVWGDKVVFNSNVTTNGFAITDELIRDARDIWHAKKFHLTIDGWREEHGRRKNYYDKSKDSYEKLLMDMRKLIDAGIFVVCRLNLDKNNLPMLDAILDDLDEFKSSNLFYVHNTTLRCPSAGDPDDYILQKDFPWVYEKIFRAMYAHGFYKEIKHILPLRLRGNCLARVMNEVIIGADGLLYKCEQYPTLPQFSVGDVKRGIVFNDVYKSWIDPSIPREKCRECAYLPLCGGGCKQYWDAKRPEVISPCVRESAYMEVIARLVHEWVVQGGIAPMGA